MRVAVVVFVKLKPALPPRILIYFIIFVLDIFYSFYAKTKAKAIAFPVVAELAAI